MILKMISNVIIQLPCWSTWACVSKIHNGMCTMGTVGIMIKLRGLRHPLLLGKAGKQPVTESITFHSTFFFSSFCSTKHCKVCVLKIPYYNFLLENVDITWEIWQKVFTRIWPKMELRAPQNFKLLRHFVKILAIILIVVIIIITMIMIMTMLKMMTRSPA